MKRIVVVGLCLIVGFFADARAEAQAPSHVGLTSSWGQDANRAGPGDRASLERDLEQLLNAERAINLMGADVTQLQQIERDKEMVGSEDTAPGLPAAQYRRMRSWWAVNVLQPALDIAANPAATCDLARQMALRAAVMAHAAELVAAADEPIGNVGNTAAILNLMVRIGSRRCLEEAYDECMLTGSASGFRGALFTSIVRQRWTRLGEDREWDNQVLYAIRRCAVYKLDYTMTIRIARATAGNSVTSEWKGSYVMLFDEGAVSADLTDGILLGDWKAPRFRVPPEKPDLSLQRVTCESLRYLDLTNCTRMSEETTQGGAVLQLQFKHDVREQIARVLYEPGTTHADGVLQSPSGGGGRKQIEYTLRPEGKDGLNLHFGPPVVFLQSRSRGHLAEHVPEGGTDFYYDAHGRRNGFGPTDILEADSAARGEYPMLFTANSIARPPAGTSQVSESTRFELTHRPDLFPQDMVYPAYELKQTQPRPLRVRA